MQPIEKIRNFSIIAHIDHGKSTLADRLIQFTNTVSSRDMKEQILDSMDLERERGITIKANSVRLSYRAKNGNEYILNLIDTPGHVDFSYEVSRSMRAVEGSLLVVDASQGVEAQTLANVYTALEADHEIFPILNKVDLPASDCDKVAQQIEEVIGLDASSALQISAKTGKGIDEVLEAIVKTLPPPKGTYTNPLKAMLIDSWYDSYLGVVVMIRIVDGELKKGDKIIMMQSGAKYIVDSVGVLKPKIQNVGILSAGEIGVFTASIKQVRDTRVGDTITLEGRPCSEPLAGYEPAKPVVFCGFFPVDSSELPRLYAEILSKNEDIKKLCKKFIRSNSVLYLGRDILYPIALEGALKLKEISYLHAEGYASGELKHGPIALIDKSMPIVALNPSTQVFEKTLSNLEEVKARKGKIILFTDEKGKELSKNLTKSIFQLPSCSDFLVPILYALPLQLIAYYTALEKGTDVDQPRNLAKSVTVE